MSSYGIHYQRLTFGRSNMHSRPVFRHRRHGGLSAPSHRIFCLRHAFWEWRVSKTCRGGEKGTNDEHKHLGSSIFNAVHPRLKVSYVRGTRLRVFTAGFSFLSPLSSPMSCGFFWALWGRRVHRRKGRRKEETDGRGGARGTDSTTTRQLDSADSKQEQAPSDAQ